MRKVVLISSIFLIAGGYSAQAATVLDINNSPANVITSVDLFNKNTDGTNDPSGKSYAGVTINESYGADKQVPYSFNAGTALVNANDTFFDKTVTLTSFDDDPANTWDQLFIKFKVTNDTPYAWSGYNLEFYNSTFTQKLGLTLLQVGTGSATYPVFEDALFDKQTPYGFANGSEIHFWSDTVRQLPGQTNEVWLRWDWGNPLDPYALGDTIGVRQIASPVPLPAALPLFVSALGVLGLIRRK